MLDHTVLEYKELFKKNMKLVTYNWVCALSCSPDYQKTIPVKNTKFGKVIPSIKALDLLNIKSFPSY